MAKVSTKGYKKNSKDKNEPFLRIPSGMITMREDDGTPLKKGPILGIDNFGNQQLMLPGVDYQFPGNSVYEIPMAKKGGAKKVKIKSLPKAQSGPSSSGLTPEQQQNYEDRYLVYRDQGDSPIAANNLAFNDASYFNTDPVLDFQPFLPNPDSGVRIASGKRFPLEHMDWSTYDPWGDMMRDPEFVKRYNDPKNANIQGRIKSFFDNMSAETYYKNLDNVKAWERDWYSKRAQLPQFTDVANKRLNLINSVNMQPFADEGEFNEFAPDAAAAFFPYGNYVGIPATSFSQPSNYVHERSHWFDWNAPQNDDMYNGSYFRSYLKPGRIPNPVYNDEDLILNSIIPGNYKMPYGSSEPLRLGENDTNTYDSESERIINNLPNASDNIKSSTVKIPFKGQEMMFGNTRNNVEYYSNPTEVRARLNEWRMKNNIDPTKDYSNEELQQIIDNDIKNNRNLNFDLYKVIQGRGDLLKQINDSYVSTGNKENPDEIPKAQNGMEMPFGLPLKEQNIYTLPEYIQPKNPMTGEILPDPRRPNLGMGTGATEYKTTIGYDEGDVDAPMIVSGQYVGPQGAIDRYELTGERFKTMTDPGSYSKFYEQIGRLGLMQEKDGGQLPKAQFGPPDWRDILDYRNAAPPAKQNLVGDVRKVARPTAVAESTNVPTQKLPDNYRELQQQKIAQDAYDALPEAMKRRDTVSANNTSSTQKAINQAYYALSNPVEAAGNAMKYGYLPQGNMGNYGLRQDGDAFSDTFNSFVNPFAWGNAAYRFANDVTDKDSWTTGLGAVNMGADFAEALPFFGAAAKTMVPAVKSFASHPLVNGLHQVAANKQLYGPLYTEALLSKVANSLTSPFGVPLYKLPGINKAYKNAAYSVGRQSGMQSRSLKQIKDAVFGKGPGGSYTGGDYSDTGQQLLRQYIYGDAPYFEQSGAPQIGLEEYVKQYGSLDNFKLKMSIPEGRSFSINDVAPSKVLYGPASGTGWKSMNPSLAYLDKLDDPLSIQNAFADEVRKKGTVALSRNNPGMYTSSDIGGHNLFVTHDPITDQFSSHIQDIWKFTPKDYVKRYTLVGEPQGRLAKTKDLNQYKIYQQAKLMEKAGKPFVLHDVRPFEMFPTINGKPAAAPQLLHLADDADSDAFTKGFKAMYNAINLKKNPNKELGGGVKRVKIKTLPNNWKRQ